MANVYCNASTVKSAWPNFPGGSNYDVVLNTLSSQVSRAIDRYTKVEDGYWYVSTSQTRYFNGSGEACQWIDDIAGSPISVGIAETGKVDSIAGTGGSYNTIHNASYFTWPYNAESKGEPFKRLDLDILNGGYYSFYGYPRSVKVQAWFGYSRTLPEEIERVAITQTIRSFQRSKQAFQDAAGIKDLGQITYVKALDPEVALMINHLKKVII